MGLSDEERLSGIYYAIDRITDIVKSLERCKGSYEYPKTLVNYLKKLWHSFIGGNHNAAHWILGSSASQDVDHYSDSIWGIAGVNHHTNGLFKEKSSIIKESDEFNVFEGYLDIAGLLGTASPVYRSIYEIYSWSEQIIYYLRRYEDKFLKNREELSKIISDIQGECFHLFKQTDVYARAYILSHVCKIIYTNKYPYDSKHYDALTRFLVNHHGYHDLNRPMQDSDIKYLAQIHARLHRAEKAKKLTVMIRAEAFMQIAGRKFSYEFKFKELVKAIKPNAKDLGILNLLFLQCQDEHKKEEKRSSETYSFNKSSPLSIYGYDVE